jgi:uncharacterized protein
MRITNFPRAGKFLSLALSVGIVSVCLLFLTAQIARSQMPTTRSQGYVSDFAGVLSPQAKQQLEALCKELDEKTHAQLAIVTVKALQGRPIEDFSIDLATKWGIGYKGGPRDAKADQGILLLLAIDDREDRIEVGYGLEPIITDGRAGSILRSMTPNLRNGDYDGALWLAAASIGQPIANEYGVTLAALAAGPATSVPDESENQTPILFILMPIILLVIFSVMARRRGWRGPGGYYGGWGGGFGGGGFSSGGGGGGFGGFGGGSFGGGGASGKW